MVKDGKLSRMVTGVLAVMVLASLLLAIVAIIAPAPALAQVCEHHIAEPCQTCGVEKRQWHILTCYTDCFDNCEWTCYNCYCTWC